MKHLLLSLASVLAFSSCASTKPSDCCEAKDSKCKDHPAAACCDKPGATKGAPAAKHQH